MQFEIWGLSGSLTTERDDQMTEALAHLQRRLGDVDNACNRFRPESEISLLNATHDVDVPVSDTLALALTSALRASEATQGLCDPTVLPALLALGYDRDYDELKVVTSIAAQAPVVPLGTSAIHFDPARQVVALDAGCQLDLGASAKALLVDLVADDVAASGGVVVELGGDVAVRGVGPQGPWAIAVSDSLQITGHEPRISLRHGGVATSSTTTRTWRVGDRVVNHVIDPRTGSYAHGPYATASVTASDCVLANAFATAALLWGDDAGYHVAQAGWAARFVRTDGTVEFVGGWPNEAAAAS
jgi:thiamine biosynthesis lipoprotein